MGNRVLEMCSKVSSTIRAKERAEKLDSLQRLGPRHFLLTVYHVVPLLSLGELILLEQSYKGRRQKFVLRERLNGVGSSK
jgi:hypothetical protein